MIDTVPRYQRRPAASAPAGCARVVLLVAGLLLPARAAVAGRVRVAPFEFTIPEGWTDLSPGAPESNFEGLDPAAVAAARGDGAAMVAVDLAGAGDGFAENVNARIVDCPGPFDEDLLGQLARAIVSPDNAPSFGGLTATLVESRIVAVGGATGAWILFDISRADGFRVRTAQYHIPGGTTCAILSYSTTPAAYATYAPIFEAAALATTGAADPPSRFSCARYLGAGLRGGVIGGIIGALSALALGTGALVRRARRRPTDVGTPPADTPPT